MPVEKLQKYEKLFNYSRHSGGLEQYLINLLGDNFSVYRDNWKKVSNREFISEFPLFVIIETTAKCNFNCRICFRSNRTLREQVTYSQKMTMDSYKRIIDECSDYNCPSVGINNNNEPLLDREIVSKLNYAKKKGIMDILMNTNASLLNSKLSEALIDSGLTRLMVSLDAATEETYGQIRSGNYSKIIKNIETFLNIRARKNTKLPILRLSFCVVNINEHEKAPFVEMWKTKADEISFQRYTPPVKDDYYLSLYPQSREPMEFKCNQPFERIIIKGDGKVFPCCYQSMDREVGNINHQTIHSLWHSDDFNEYRRIVKEKDWSKNKNCLQCSQTR